MLDLFSSFIKQCNTCKKKSLIDCLTPLSSISITVLPVQDHRWLCGCHACALALTAMWATLAGAQRTGRVGEALDAVCMLLPAEGFVSGGGGDLVIIGLQLRAVKPGAALCGGEPLLLLLIFSLLMGIQKQ